MTKLLKFYTQHFLGLLSAQLAGLNLAISSQTTQTVATLSNKVLNSFAFDVEPDL